MSPVLKAHFSHQYLPTPLFGYSTSAVMEDPFSSAVCPSDGGRLDPTSGFLGPGDLTWFQVYTFTSCNCKLVLNAGIDGRTAEKQGCPHFMRCPKFTCWNLMPDVIVLGGRAFGRCSGHGCSLMNWCFIKTPHSS